MASSNIGKWLVQAGVDARGVTTGTQQIIRDAQRVETEAGASFGRLSQYLNSKLAGPMAFGGLGSLTTMLSGALGPAAGIGVALGATLGLADKIGASIHHWVEEGQAALRTQDRLSQQLGITRQGSAALTTVGGVLGIDPETIRHGALRTLQEMGQLRMALASGETGGERATAFSMLGMNAREASMMRYTELVG